jgi:biotin transporter BioY
LGKKYMTTITKEVLLDGRKRAMFLLDFLIVATCSLAVVVLSKLRIPFFPVPFTMQTFAVVAVSLLIGRRRALLSLLLFILLYTPQSILTFGYILSFFVVPFIVGDDVDELSSAELAFRIFCSHLIILTIGALGLACFIGLKAALLSGFVFFIPAELFKGILSFALVKVRGKLTS